MALAIAVLAFVQTFGTFTSWLPPTWIDTTALWRENLVFVGPFVAAAGALLGGAHQALPFVGPPGRPGHSVVAQHLGPAVIASQVGYLAGLVPAAVYTAFMATSGRPQFMVLGTSLVQLAALMALGYLGGAVFSTRLMPAVAAGTTWLWMLAIPLATSTSSGTNEFGRSYYSLGIVWLDFRPDYGQRESAGSAVARLLLFGVLLGAIVLALLEYVDRRRDGQWTARLFSFFLVPLVAGVVLVGSQPGLISVSEDVNCRPSGTTTVCVPSEVRVLLDPLVETTTDAERRLGFGAISGRVSAEPISDFVPFTLRAGSLEGVRGSARLALSFAIAGYIDCRLQARAQQVTSTPEGERVAGALVASIARRLGSSPSEVESAIPPDVELQVRFESLSDDELRQYLTSNATRLASCSAAAPTT